MGVYEDDYSKFGYFAVGLNISFLLKIVFQYFYLGSLVRACRLVVDTGNWFYFFGDRYAFLTDKPDGAEGAEALPY